MEEKLTHKIDDLTSVNSKTTVQVPIEEYESKFTGKRGNQQCKNTG